MEERPREEQASAPHPVEEPAVHPTVLPPEPSSPPAPEGDFGCMAALAGLFRHAGEAAAALTSPSRVGTKKARSPQQPGSEERARTAPRPRVAVDEGGSDKAVGAAGPAAGGGAGGARQR
ncbi:hypothetical protein CYMTET_18668 [Cymbomonas tetramitiformis]|uniref:Uncharacterized protein n=1 Tax=Cymbomonas tetramitiformis TaxID=36881 RepID=A0AAE0L5N6_9CHLO|nr:hypothetical protein CYMTET_18668 [Cymbomonas tetramitiformis]